MIDIEPYFKVSFEEQVAIGLEPFEILNENKEHKDDFEDETESIGPGSLEVVEV
jgi:hypothetical protein